jgi:transcriptional antiterminator RfaH
MPSFWYAIQSHPNKEDFLWEQLRSREIEVFFPRVRVQTVNPRAKKVKAYFPGYMFVRVDLEALGISTLQWMPQARGLVSFGGEAAVVPDSLIHAIRQRVGEISKAGGELFDGLKSGDEVFIHDGPFAGYEAIFDLRVAGSERVRVLLQLLNKTQLPVELDAGAIRKKKRAIENKDPKPLKDKPNG